MGLVRSLAGLLLFAVLYIAGVAAGFAVALGMRWTAAGEDLRLLCGTCGGLLVTIAMLVGLRRAGVLAFAKKGRRKWAAVRAVVVGLAWIVPAVIAWYLISRAVSPWHYVRICDSDTAVEQPPPAELTQLRVGAFNIAHGRGATHEKFAGGDRAERANRLKDIARLLREQELDVVVLNEVDFSCFWSYHVNQARALARQAGFAYWAEQRDYDVAVPLVRMRFGSAVLSKYPIARARSVDYPGRSRWLPTAAGKKRGMVCTIELPGKLPGGRSVRVMPVHLDPCKTSIRIASAEVISRECASSDVPLIAAGDFNSTRADFPCASPDASGRTAMSVLLDTGQFSTFPDRVTEPAEFTFSSMKPVKVIDWILVSRPWKLQSSEVVPSMLSDHRPVFGTVELRPTEPDKRE